MKCVYPLANDSRCFEVKLHCSCPAEKTQANTNGSRGALCCLLVDFLSTLSSIFSVLMRILPMFKNLHHMAGLELFLLTSYSMSFKYILVQNCVTCTSGDELHSCTVRIQQRTFC